MPIKISSTGGVTIGIATICIALSGCRQQATMGFNLAKSVPGTYDGSFNAYAEAIHFSSNGTYVHNVYQNGKTIHSDSGKWAIAKDSVRIDLSPNEVFTEFYDPTSRSFSSKPRPFGSYVYWPIMKGNVPERISPSVEYEYSLRRRSDDSTNSLNRVEQ